MSLIAVKSPVKSCLTRGATSSLAREAGRGLFFGLEPLMALSSPRRAKRGWKERREKGYVHDARLDAGVTEEDEVERNAQRM